MSNQRDFQKFVKELAAEYTDIQTVRLGRLDGSTVETGTAGELWARQHNGREIRVINRAFVPSDFDLRVLVGKQRVQRGRWFVLTSMEDYLTPATGGRVAYHREQHELGGADEVAVHRKQITSMSIRVSDGPAFKVQVYGGYFPSSNGFGYTVHQEVDLSSYVPSLGAKYIAIEVDDDGALSVHDGDLVDAYFLLNKNVLPLPDPGKYHVGSVALFEGQEEILEEHISVPMPLGVIAKNAGLQINEADADTPANDDEFGFWDVVDNILKKITWANIKAALKTYFDTVYAALVHTHGASEITGKYRQFVYEVSGGDFSFVIDEDGNPVMALTNLE